MPETNGSSSFAGILSGEAQHTEIANSNAAILDALTQQIPTDNNFIETMTSVDPNLLQPINQSGLQFQPEQQFQQPQPVQQQFQQPQPVQPQPVQQQFQQPQPVQQQFQQPQPVQPQPVQQQFQQPQPVQPQPVQQQFQQPQPVQQQFQQPQPVQPVYNQNVSVQPVQQQFQQPQPVQQQFQQPQPVQQQFQQPQPVQPVYNQNVSGQPVQIQTGQPIVQQQMMNIDPITAFAPPMQVGQNLICKISPGKFDAFVKILSILNEKNVIIINNSNICQSINNGSAIVTANLSNLIDSSNTSISLHILNPKKYLKYFKNIKGDADIHFINDAKNERYIVTNGDMSIYLPKQIEALESDATPPDLSMAEPFGQTVEIDKEVRSIITTMASDSPNIDLLIHDNQLKGVYVPEIAVYSFKDYIKDQIDDTNAQLKLRSYSFLQVPGDTYKVSLGRVGNTIWSLTFVNTGLVTISVLENLQPVSDENLII